MKSFIVRLVNYKGEFHEEVFEEDIVEVISKWSEIQIISLEEVGSVKKMWEKGRA
jgi:hypothetical protein